MEHIDALAHDTEVLAPQFTALADSIWDEPELRWDEYRSMEKQIQLAEHHGFSVTRNVAGIRTAFSAEKGTSGPVIAVLGEYDALAELSQESGTPRRCPDPANTSGAGHGCGHHLLGAGSLLAAVATARYLSDRGLPGRVRYCGCPAEEAAAGKTFMVKNGAFSDVDAAISWHPTANTYYRQARTLAYTQVYFHYEGLSAHAGAMPHLGRSALDAVELLNVGTNFLREHMPDSARIHYAITDAGGRSPNVVQAHASVYYIVRAADTDQMRELYGRVLDIAEGAALMTGTKLSVEFDGACSEILPNNTLEQALYRNMTALGGVPFDAHDQAKAAEFTGTLDRRQIEQDKLAAGWSPHDTRNLHDELPEPNFTALRPLLTGSTDVGDVSWSVPTVQLGAATYALGTPFHAWETVAQGKLEAAHKGMVYAAKAMAGTAISIISDPDLLTAARSEFDACTRQTPYVCPIPEGVIAPPLRPAGSVPEPETEAPTDAIPEFAN